MGLVKVMFVSTQNALRGPVAEACLRHLGGQQFQAFSCGVPGQIAKAVDPLALKVLARAGMPMGQLQPKSWDKFVKPGAPRMDFVIGLDAGTAASHPVWPSQPEHALWSSPPLSTDGAPPESTEQQVTQMLLSLHRRVDLLVNLHAKVKHRSELRNDLRDLGHL